MLLLLLLLMSCQAGWLLLLAGSSCCLLVLLPLHDRLQPRLGYLLAPRSCCWMREDLCCCICRHVWLHHTWQCTQHLLQCSDRRPHLPADTCCCCLARPQRLLQGHWQYTRQLCSRVAAWLARTPLLLLLPRRHSCCCRQVVHVEACTSSTG
jgi:hypothetical protein